MYRRTLAGSAMILYVGIGCVPSGTVAELAQEDLAEAVANQAISGYYEVSLSVTNGDGVTVGLDCSKGGTLTWAEYVEGDGSVCYEADSNGCTMSGGYGDLTLEGSYTICGFPATLAEDGTISDLDGQTLYIEGEITASDDDSNSKKCSYDMEYTRIEVSDNGNGTVTFSSGLSGSLCGDRGFDTDLSFTVSNQMEVDESTIE